MGIIRPVFTCPYKRNRHFRQTTAIIERTRTYTRHVIGNCEIGNIFIFYPIDNAIGRCRRKFKA